METETVQRRGDLAWFKALQKQWENRPKGPETPPIVEAPKNPHRERLVAFYQMHNPNKIDAVDNVLEKYKGKEDELFEKLEQRYASDDRYASPPPADMLPPNCPVCFLQFSDVIVKIQLFSHITPLAAENFRLLCRTKYRNSKIHRIVPGMCIQGGDYTTGDGTGGRSIYPIAQDGIDMWGNFPDETFLAHDSAGLLSMANNGKNRNGSQFFITLAPAKHLNGKHVVFGRVIEHLDSILDLGKRATDAKTQRPLQDITIVDCGEILDNVWHRASELPHAQTNLNSPTLVPAKPFGSISANPSPFGTSSKDKVKPKALVFGSPSPIALSSFDVNESKAQLFGDSLGGDDEKSPFGLSSSTSEDVRDTATSFGGFSFGASRLQQTTGDANGAEAAFSFGSQKTNTTSSSKEDSQGQASREDPSITTFGRSIGIKIEGFNFQELASTEKNDTTVLSIGDEQNESSAVSSTDAFPFGKTSKGLIFGSSIAGNGISGDFAALKSHGTNEAPRQNETSMFQFGGSTQEQSSETLRLAETSSENMATSGTGPTKSPGFGSIGLGEASDDKAPSFGEIATNESGFGKREITFGANAGGLSFGSLEISGKTDAAFGSLGKGDQSPFEQKPSKPSAFAALHAVKPSVFGGSSLISFGESKATSNSSFVPTTRAASGPTVPLVLTAANERRGNAFRARDDDSNSTESEESDGSEYVDNIAHDSSDQDAFDEYHSASGDEEIASAQPSTFLTSRRSTSNAPIAPETALTANQRAKKSVSSQEENDLTDVTAGHSIPGLGDEAIDAGNMLSETQRLTRTHSEADILPTESELHSKDDANDLCVVSSPPRVPSEVVCEQDPSCEPNAKCQVKSAEKSFHIPDEVVCDSFQLPDLTQSHLVGDEFAEDDEKVPALEHTDTMPVDNTTEMKASDETKIKTKIISQEDRPPERIEFEAGEKSSNVSFESHEAYTPNSSRVDEYDPSARQSVGEETMESEILNSIATVDSSVSGQAELLRRDIEVCSLDIEEALRRVERQKERVRCHQVSSAKSTPNRYRRSLLPPRSAKRPQSLGNEASRTEEDIDPASRFVYLSRIAQKLSNGPLSRRSPPDEKSLRRESSSYTSPILVQEADLENMQREARSVQPLVETFERWTKDHIEKQKTDLSPVKKETNETSSNSDE